MASTILTLSPRMPIDRAERIARGRVARDGSAHFAASSSDKRQMDHLRRFHDQLAADPGLSVSSGVADGVAYVSVMDAGHPKTVRRLRPDGRVRATATALRGSPKTG